jgi:chromate transporter
MIFQIFYVFARISLLSFGGVFGIMPLMEQYVVKDHQWLTHEQFMQAYALGGFAPGPNMAMCALIGFWVAGLPGWGAAMLGIYAPTLVMMSGAWWIFSRYRHIEIVRRSEHALRPMVLGLILASTLRFFWSFSVTPFQRMPLENPIAVEFVTRLPAIVLAAIVIPLLFRKKLNSFAFVFGVGALWALIQVGLTSL